MATILHGKRDLAVKAIKKILDQYERENPSATAEVYRQNVASIRVRIVDEKFAGVPKGDRHKKVFDFIVAELDDDYLQEISVLLLLAPSELNSSLMNLEFDDPIPSGF